MANKGKVDRTRILADASGANGRASAVCRGGHAPSAAAPLRRRAGVAHIKELFGVASSVRTDLLYFLDLVFFVLGFWLGSSCSSLCGCCAGGDALHLDVFLLTAVHYGLEFALIVGRHHRCRLSPSEHVN